MASNNVIKAAATAALVSNGGVVPECPVRPFPKYHNPHVCQTKPSRPMEGHNERRMAYDSLLASGTVASQEGHNDRRMAYDTLLASGTGASLVPNTQTVTCPFGEVQNLESPTAVRGFDTKWIVENTSAKNVVVAWIVDGIEYSPFHPDLKPMEDPNAILKPGDWISVPTFESFVYHVRELDGDGALGNVVLQHRAGMIPIGNPRDFSCSANLIDAEPFSPETVAQPPQQQEVGRGGTRTRPCNTIDVGFRNQVGCPLSVYWANNLVDVPEQGFSCDEKYKFHMGTKAAPQDFMFDWNSMTKYEGSIIGQTFVARLASDPSVIIDKFTLEPTIIIDCPTTKKQQVIMAASNVEVAEREGITTSTSSAVNDDYCLIQEENLPASGSRGAPLAAAGLSGTSG